MIRLIRIPRGGYKPRQPKAQSPQPDGRHDLRGLKPNRIFEPPTGGFATLLRRFRTARVQTRHAAEDAD
jgi:hypothetical protein